MKASRRLIVFFLLLFLGTSNYVYTAVYYAFNGESSASITSPDVYLEQGTAGTSVVYPNATSAASQVDSHATTFYPNDYNVTHGLYDSGSTPSSVNQVDSDYFTVNSTGYSTLNLSYYPTGYTLVNGTTHVSGSLANLTDADGVNMVFRSYTWNSTQEDYVDINTSNVDSSPSIGLHSNFTAQQQGPDTITDSLTEHVTDWWDANYLYRKVINVTTGINVPFKGYAGYTVQYSVDTAALVTAGKMLSNGNDLRIISLNGSIWEEIDRQVIDVNTITTQVRFQLKYNISASSFDDSYYMYYGYSEAGSGPVNYSNVYLWYDDAVIDREAQYTQGRVDETAHGGGWANAISWNSGGYYAYDTGDNYADSLRPTVLDERDVYVEYEEYQSNAYTTDMTSGPLTRWIGTGSGGTEASSHWYYYEMADSAYLAGSYASHDDITADNRGSVVVSNGLLGTFPQTSYTRMALASWNVNPTTLKAWYDASPTEGESGSFEISGRFNGTHTAASDNEGAGEVGIWLQQDAGRVRNLLIRRYVEPEPILNLENEEEINFKLDSEEQWTNVDFDETYEELCIYSSDWLIGWDNRVKIEIDHNEIDSDLTDFPVLLHLSGSSGYSYDDVSYVFDELQNDANRKKIAVTLADKITQCYVEVEKWDDANEQAWLWVKVPSISSTTDTELYLYFDVDQSDNTGNVGDPGSNPALKVWSSSYQGVWHLDESAGGASAIKDSTINMNNGTDYGGPTFNIDGRIDSAIEFDGLDDYLRIPNSGSLQFTGALTIEAWVKLETFGAGSDVDVVVRKGEGNPNDYQLAIHDQNPTLMLEEGDEGGLSGSTSLSGGQWYHVVATWNGTTRKVYLNGTQDASGSWIGSIVPDTRDIYIGGRAGADLSDGFIDEVRAANISRSDAWIKASFESQRDHLLDFNKEETLQSTSLDATGGYMIIGDGTPDWGSTSGTISFWVKWDTLSNRPWGQHENMETRISGSNLVLDWGVAGSLTSTTSFMTGNWYFIAITWNETSNILRLYVGDQGNAPSLDSENLAWANTVSTVGVTQNNFMASKGGVEPLDGHGDDLRYWDTDRSLLEIQSDYDSEIVGSTINLRSYFKLNEDFYDIGPDDNHGSGSGSHSFSTDVPFISRESIMVDVWYNSTWNNVFSQLSPGWNNVSVSSYLNTSTFTIRIRGNKETSDPVQDDWQIDCSLLHLWSTHHTTEVEFEGSSNLYTWTQIQWFTNISCTVDSVNITIQLYNHNATLYPSSGDGYLSYISGNADIKELKNQIISTTPESYRNGTGGWRMRIIGDKVTSTQYDLNIDLITLLTTYYSEYMSQTEFIFNDVTDNQSPNLNFTVINHNSVTNVNMTIQVYNYTSGSYPTSGQGYLNYVSNWLAGWDQRVKLTIDHNDVDSDLSDFPALIHLGTSSGRNNDDVSFVFDELQNDANRLKIAVTTGDGATQCYVEIEEWDDTNEEAWLWVKVPGVNSTSDTELYLYYDADHADNTAYVGDPNSSPAGAVWDDDFRLVSHMRDDPDTSHIRDSTGYDNDGTKTAAGEPVVTIGNVSDAQDFDGSDDYVDLGSDSSLDLRSSNFTIEAWIYPTTQTVAWPTIYAVGTWEISLGIGQDTNTDKLETWVNDNDDYASDSDVTYNAWNHVVLSWNGTHYNFFIDGVADGSRSGSAYPDTGTTYIGGIPPWEDEDCFNGTIDEVRVSNTSRASSWIKTCFESGRDDLVDFGGEDTYTTWLNITNNAQSCLSGSYARIRVTSVYSTTDYYQQLTNFVRLLQEESTRVNDYALRVTNNGTDLYTIRLVRISDSNIDRIINCTIYFRSGETQLQVIDGAFTLTTGTWANLPATSSLDIIIDASTIHLQYASVIDTELEVLMSGTSTYTKYPIQFTIT